MSYSMDMRDHVLFYGYEGSYFILWLWGIMFYYMVLFYGYEGSGLIL